MLISLTSVTFEIVAQDLQLTGKELDPAWERAAELAGFCNFGEPTGSKYRQLSHKLSVYIYIYIQGVTGGMCETSRYIYTGCNRRNVRDFGIYIYRV